MVVTIILCVIGYVLIGALTTFAFTFIDGDDDEDGAVGAGLAWPLAWALFAIYLVTEVIAIPFRFARDNANDIRKWLDKHKKSKR